MAVTIIQALTASQLEPVDARALLRHALGVGDAHLIAHFEQTLTEDQNRSFSVLVARRRAGEPVAYITGRREFFSLEFKVTPAVLIPRTETELLVEFALEHISADAAWRVLDLGTGSGCIAISIATHRPRAEVVALDANAAALAVAYENARLLLGRGPETPFPSTGEGTRDTFTPTLPPRGLSTHLIVPEYFSLPFKGRVGVGMGVDSAATAPHPPPNLPLEGGGNRNLRLLRSDWFAALAGQRFDLIVSNPPYVAAGDPHLGHGDVRFEPRAALVAGADGLECIRLIVTSAPGFLERGGWLVFEHGYDQSRHCRELLAAAGFAQIFSRADLAGIERISGGRRDAKS